MSLTGSPRPTFYYPRFKYGSPAVTLDIPEPVMAFLPNPPTTGLAYENRVASGKTEVLFARNEEQCGVVLRCESDMLLALRWMAEDSTFRGNQFQAWIDRFTGSCWQFENTLKDQNGLVLTLSNGSATYAAASTGTGLTTSGSQYLTVTLAQASASTPTGFDDPLTYTEGVIIIDFKPSWNASDSTNRDILDTTLTSNNRIQISKDSSNILNFVIHSGGDFKKVSASVAGAWVSGDRVQLVADHTTGGTLVIRYAVNGGAFTAITSATGSGNGIMTSLPTTLYIGANNTGTNPGLGTYDTVAFFKRAFSNPHLSLIKWRPWRRNYFPYGEIVGRQFAPQQISFAVPVWDWPIVFRNGRP